MIFFHLLQKYTATETFTVQMLLIFCVFLSIMLMFLMQEVKNTWFCFTVPV